MFIIFGWGRQAQKDYGNTHPVVCPNCNNNTFWSLSRIRTWFTMFFLPVIPYSNKHILFCEVCGYAIPLKGDKVNKAKDLNELTQMYLDKQMSKEEYERLLDEAQLLE